MPGTNSRQPPLLRLLWSLWAELGIPGWTARHHRDWWIDPEALLLATTAWADLDARLSEEVLEWTVRHEHLLSAGRFKTLAAEAPQLAAALTRPPAAALLANLRAHTQLRLPAETASSLIDDEMRHRELRRTSDPLDLGAPARLSLRLRAIFGVGARAEILRIFLTGRSADFLASALVDRGLGFTKRAAQLVLDDLLLAGILKVRRRGHVRIYRLADPAHIEALVGPVPSVALRWIPLLELLEGTRTLDIPGSPTPSQTLTLRTRARALDAAAEQAEVPPPPHEVQGEAFCKAIIAWQAALLESLAAGRSPPSPPK